MSLPEPPISISLPGEPLRVCDEVEVEEKSEIPIEELLIPASLIRYSLPLAITVSLPLCVKLKSE